MAASTSTRFLVLLKDFSAFRKISWTCAATNFHRQSRFLCHVAKEDGSLTLASLDLGNKPRKFGKGKAMKLEGSFVTEMGQGKVRAVKNDKMKVVKEKKPAEIVSPLFSAKSFEELGLPDSLLDSLEREGFSVPTDVQSAAVPAIIKGHDAVIQSYTGSGKTLAYLLPILSEIGPLAEKSRSSHSENDKRTEIQAMIVAPSRELGMQIVREVEKLLGPVHRRMVQQLVGGANRMRQEEALKKNKPAIVVGTPGRIAEISKGGKLHTHGCRFLVLDEVDELLSFNFREDIHRILEHVGKNDLMDMADEDVMMLLPQFFSPKDRPDNLVLRLPVTSSPKKKDEELTQNLYEIDIGPVFAIDFSVKEIPKILKWEDYIVPTSNQWKWQVAVSALFEERPVWTRDSIVQRLLDKGLTCTHHMLNRFLLRAAYYFSGGPFLRFWIKRGYDPRKDPESRVFQRMEFRVPPELKGYCDSNATNKSKPSWDDICAFKVFPFKCQTFLQLFELDDEYIQQEIRKPPKQTTCNYKTGWFSEALLDNLRLRVAVRFVSVFPEPGFEDVFKSIQEEFERSEKTRIQKDALQPSQRNHQETTKDMKKCKNTNKEKDDDDISISSHGYGDMENNSRTYLQGLFNRFPSSASALYGSANDDNDSDGEYPIYEQESNALDDDEEDDE